MCIRIDEEVYEALVDAQAKNHPMLPLGEFVTQLIAPALDQVKSAPDSEATAKATDELKQSNPALLEFITTWAVWSISDLATNLWVDKQDAQRMMGDLVRAGLVRRNSQGYWMLKK